MRGNYTDKSNVILQATIKDISEASRRIFPGLPADKHIVRSRGDRFDEQVTVGFSRLDRFAVE